ncbi:VLRF1 family aeRF1-type release factor [Sediminibacillus massiliensis]|uniref:VLRF1 family aeRF1-type release factor n=1 Tax=Sediminibacillus massiliensis TaxID=1926277 RepID=UPI000988523E|nr:VLRF1 family aeRF1-type release factor [Sediminibacillus massiliensis]
MIDRQLKELDNIELEKPNRVFSMYLNTDPSDPEQQGGEWKIHLKNGLKNFESYLQESKDKEEFDNFLKVKDKVENFVRDNEQALRKGIVLFASADNSVWFAERIQMRVENQFFWEASPQTDQLKELETQFPKLGIILVQQNQVKVIEAEMGEILETKHYELDLDTEDWKEITTPQKTPVSMGKGGKNLGQDNFSARLNENQKRWYKSIAPKLDKLAKGNSWNRIYLVGEKEEAKDMEEYMNKDIYKVEGKNMLEHEESKVIEKIVA